MKSKRIKNFVGLSALFVIGLSTFSMFDNQNLTQKVNAKQTGYQEYHVSNYAQFEQAMKQGSNNGMNLGTTIILEDDINLADFRGITWGSDLFYLRIDGQGHSFYNKPKNYYFHPILFEWQNSYQLQVRNLVLDDSPFLFGSIWQSSVSDYVFNDESIDWQLFMNSALFFNNITIENTEISGIKNQVINWSQGKNSGQVGIIGGNIMFLEETMVAGMGDADYGIYLGNILIQDNEISNNDIILDPYHVTVDPNPIKSFSWLTNISYFSDDGNLGSNHKAVVYVENISISNNKFYNNTFQWSDNSTQYFSFGNLFGNFRGSTNWDGTSGNYLSIQNINIENNLYEKVTTKQNATLENSYGELISQPKTNSSNSQLTKIKEFKNIIILNNLIYSNYDEKDSQNNEYVNQKDITVINMEDSGTNEWNENSADTMMFVGPNYSNSESLNVMGYNSASLGEFNSVFHDTYLSRDDARYTAIEQKLMNKFGIYGYLIMTQNLILENGEALEVVSSINLAHGDTLDLIEVDVNQNSETNLVESIDVKFKFSLNNTISINEDGSVDVSAVYEPYKLSNLVLYNGEEVVATSDETIETTNSENYVYSITFDVEGIEEMNMENFSLGFNYGDTLGRSTSTFKASINYSDLENSLVFNNNYIEVNGLSRNVSIALGVIITIIIFILLIILAIFLMKRYKLSKVGEVQDGFLEFVSESSDGNYYNNDYNIGYQEYDETYYDDEYQVEYDSQDYDYEYQNEDDTQNYDYEQENDFNNYSYEDQYEYDETYYDYESDDEFF